MNRVITFNDETENGQHLLSFIKQFNDASVQLSEPFLAITPEELALPGKPATVAQIEYLLNTPDDESVSVDEFLKDYNSDNQS